MDYFLISNILNQALRLSLWVNQKHVLVHEQDLLPEYDSVFSFNLAMHFVFLKMMNGNAYLNIANGSTLEEYNRCKAYYNGQNYNVHNETGSDILCQIRLLHSLITFYDSYENKITFYLFVRRRYCDIHVSIISSG